MTSLYVWVNQGDYKFLGIAYAIAETEEEARLAVLEDVNDLWKDRVKKMLEENQPAVTRGPYGAYHSYIDD